MRIEKLSRWISKAEIIAYSHGNYYEMGKKIGKFGWSVMKEKTKRRLGRIG